MTKDATGTEKVANEKDVVSTIPSQATDESVQEVTLEQLINAVGGVFNYLSNISISGDLKSVNAHGDSLKSLHMFQRFLINLNNNEQG